MDSHLANSQSAAPAIHAAPVAVPWIKIAWVFGLTLLLYGSAVYQMVSEWFTQDEMGHGIFVPFIAGYMAWVDRERILSLPARPHWLGIVLICWAVVQLFVGTLGADFFLARTAFILCLIGIVLWTGGFAILRALAFPLFVLLFMIRIPLFIYSQITFPLQIFASRLAEWSLMIFGIPVLRDGNILELASQRLSVVEACSGIRSLLSLSFLALVYAYFFDKKIWMRAVLFACAIPIAIATNASRITLTGILSEYKKEWAEGLYHSLEGWLIFMIALAFLIIAHAAINRFHTALYARR